MIDSISSGMSMPPPPRTDQNLTDEQQSLILETLSQFDVDNLSESDASSIVEAFAQAGIEAGSALETAMADAGFDAKTVGELASISEQASMPPPPPRQNSEEITTMVDYLTELVEEKFTEKNINALSNEDKALILSQVFEKFGIEEGSSIINTTA